MFEKILIYIFLLPGVYMKSGKGKQVHLEIIDETCAERDTPMNPQTENLRIENPVSVDVKNTETDVSCVSTDSSTDSSTGVKDITCIPTTPTTIITRIKPILSVDNPYGVHTGMMRINDSPTPFDKKQKYIKSPCKSVDFLKDLYSFTSTTFGLKVPIRNYMNISWGVLDSIDDTHNTYRPLRVEKTSYVATVYTEEKDLKHRSLCYVYDDIRKAIVTVYKNEAQMMVQGLQPSTLYNIRCFITECVDYPDMFTSFTTEPECTYEAHIKSVYPTHINTVYEYTYKSITCGTPERLQIIGKNGNLICQTTPDIHTCRGVYPSVNAEVRVRASYAGRGVEIHDTQNTQSVSNRFTYNMNISQGLFTDPTTIHDIYTILASETPHKIYNEYILQKKDFNNDLGDELLQASNLSILTQRLLPNSADTLNASRNITFSIKILLDCIYDIDPAHMVYAYVFSENVPSSCKDLFKSHTGVYMHEVMKLASDNKRNSTIE